MTSAPARHLRLVTGCTTDVPALAPLERRALADLALTCCCSSTAPLCSEASGFTPPADLHRRTSAEHAPHRDDTHCCNRCFGRWVRARLIEHWDGEHYWQELDRGDFGLLRRPFHTNTTLLADIVALLLTGNENLTVITWALATGRPLDEVVAILTVLDVNAHRLPRFRWLPSAPHRLRAGT